MKKLIVQEELLDRGKEFRPKNIDIDEKVREKLNYILKVSKNHDASNVIKGWLKNKDLYNK